MGVVGPAGVHFRPTKQAVLRRNNTLAVLSLRIIVAGYLEFRLGLQETHFRPSKAFKSSPQRSNATLPELWRTAFSSRNPRRSLPLCAGQGDGGVYGTTREWSGNAQSVSYLVLPAHTALPLRTESRRRVLMLAGPRPRQLPVRGDEDPEQPRPPRVHLPLQVKGARGAQRLRPHRTALS